MYMNIYKLLIIKLYKGSYLGFFTNLWGKTLLVIYKKFQFSGLIHIK